MTVLALDLAAKYSAWIKMSADYRVLRQADSWDLPEEAFLFGVLSDWKVDDNDDIPDVLVVEDLPHGLAYTKTVKAVCRLQGRLAEMMRTSRNGNRDDILFVAPAAWRAHFDGMGRGTGSDAVFEASKRFGYEPPDLKARSKGNGGWTRARKVASDYCAAYLIARWAVDVHQQFGTYDVPGTSRYDTPVVLKKDFNDKNR